MRPKSLSTEVAPREVLWSPRKTHLFRKRKVRFSSNLLLPASSRTIIEIEESAFVSPEVSPFCACSSRQHFGLPQGRISSSPRCTACSRICLTRTLHSLKRHHIHGCLGSHTINRSCSG